MPDVLTPAEREVVETLRKYLAACGVTTGSGPAEVALIDRLVAEVERLRTRNEALELVAANASMAAEFTPPFAVRGHEVWGALRKALAAINPPTGGAT